MYFNDGGIKILFYSIVKVYLFQLHKFTTNLMQLQKKYNIAKVNKCVHFHLFQKKNKSKKNKKPKRLQKTV